MWLILLRAQGVLSSNAPFVEFKPSHAEGKHLGEARVKTQSYIDLARGGVLFADEAHQLTVDGENMYGQQVASQLMDCLQDGDHDVSKRVIVIYAGYEKEMQTLMESDPGYSRRVQRRFLLPDYSPLELAQMFVRKAKRYERALDEKATVEMIASLIKDATTPAYRSNQNGSVAEVLLKSTDRAMNSRLEDYTELCFTLDDIYHGAQVVKKQSGLSD